MKNAILLIVGIILTIASSNISNFNHTQINNYRDSHPGDQPLNAQEPETIYNLTWKATVDDGVTFGPHPYGETGAITYYKESNHYEGIFEGYAEIEETAGVRVVTDFWVNGHFEEINYKEYCHSSYGDLLFWEYRNITLESITDKGAETVLECIKEYFEVIPSSDESVLIYLPFYYMNPPYPALEMCTHEYFEWNDPDENKVYNDQWDSIREVIFLEEMPYSLDSYSKELDLFATYFSFGSYETYEYKDIYAHWEIVVDLIEEEAPPTDSGGGNGGGGGGNGGGGGTGEEAIPFGDIYLIFMMGTIILLVLYTKRNAFFRWMS